MHSMQLAGNFTMAIKLDSATHNVTTDRRRQLLRFQQACMQYTGRAVQPAAHSVATVQGGSSRWLTMSHRCATACEL